MIAAALLIVLGIYLLCGLVFAVPFVVVGVKRIDPHALHGSWGFRLLIFPGAMALWPLLLRRWLSGIHEPPEESTAHRRAAQNGAAQ
jgi:membrane protein implicated in regulation of membrane protease activity